MKALIFLGGPGSGKGTQAKLLTPKIDGFYFGVGDLMREEAEKGTNLGKKFKSIWDQGTGGLIPEELVTQFVSQKITTFPHDKTIIFDGYPRTLSQAHGFEKILSDIQIKVLYIKVDVQHLIKRMSTRKVCGRCGNVIFNADSLGIRECNLCHGDLIQRQEDKPETIKKRVNVYNTETKPLIDYYRQKNVLIEIDGNPPIEEVEKEIMSKING